MASLQAERSGVRLVTKEVDEEFLSLLAALLELEGEEVVGICDWERPGTRTTLEIEGLFGEDLEDEKAKKRKKLKEEVDDEEFGGAEMMDALLEAGGPTVQTAVRDWSVELPDRKSVAPPSGVWG